MATKMTTKTITKTPSTTRPCKLTSIFIAALLVIIVGLAVHTPIMVFLSSRFPDHDLLFKSWKEILLVLNSFLAIILITKNHLWRPLFRNKLFTLPLAYCVLGLISALLLAQNHLSLVSGLMISFRYILIFMLVLIAQKLRPASRPLFLKSILASAIIVITFGVLQATILPRDILAHIGYSRDTILPYMTIDQNTSFIRINSTLRGPNVLGAFASITFALSAAWLLFTKNLKSQPKSHLALAIFLALGSLICIWFSYSRAAYLAAATSTAILFFFRIRSNPRLLKILALATIITITLATTTIILFRDTTLIRNIVFRDNPDSTTIYKSDDERLQALEKGLYALRNHPLGLGVGSVGSASLFTDNYIILENQFLFVAHETGWLGLALFTAIIALIFLGLAKSPDPISIATLAAGAGLLVIGLFLPVFADETVSMTFFTLAALGLTLKPKSTKKPRRKHAN